MRPARLLLAAGACALLGACHTAAPPSQELLDARAALSRASTADVKHYAEVDLQTAQQALAKAESAQRSDPGGPSAVERAYAARRYAEKARMTALYGQGLEQLENARREEQRLAADIDRAQRATEERAKRERARQAELHGKREVMRKALDRLGPFLGHTVETERGLVMTIRPTDLFLRGSPRLIPGMQVRLRQLADAITSGPPTHILVDVSSSTGTKRLDPFMLARGRAQRIRESLLARGVPFETVDTSGRQSDDSIVRVIITNRREIEPPVVMQDEREPDRAPPASVPAGAAKPGVSGAHELGRPAPSTKPSASGSNPEHVERTGAHEPAPGAR